MKRELSPELLDGLLDSDAAAIAARKDLRRLNAIMGHARILAGVLRAQFERKLPVSIVEVGAGDGSLLLNVARRLSREWAGTDATLIDRQPVVDAGTVEQFRRLAWDTTVIRHDVFRWAEQPGPVCDVVVANLFLHHFDDNELRNLLRAVAPKTSCFVALEPRRCNRALFFSRLVGLVGCNHVTRHDAPVSVLAGFSDSELSGLWPADHGWDLQEQRAGLFTHLFAAAKAHPR